MKDHFIQLFNYDRYANLISLEMILKTQGAGKATRLMAHTLAAQQVWLRRCKKEPATFVVLWPDWQADTFEQMINDNHRGWINFLDYSEPDDFGKIISYKNTQGEGFENKLSDILAHVINHGTHHRAQAGQHLKLAGTDLQLMDYTLYVRQLGN